MSLVVTYNENTGAGNGAWQNAPIGIHKSTCCDVVDLGTQETEYGPKHQCEIHFELDKETAGMVEATGNQFTVRTQRFNLPEPGHDLSEKSNLYKFLCSWRGRPMTPGDPIDLEKLLGAPATLVLAIRTSKSTGNEYTSIDSLTPKRKDEIFPPLSGAYTRRKDRDDAQPAPVPAPVQPTPAPAVNLNEDDVPF